MTVRRFLTGGVWGGLLGGLLLGGLLLGLLLGQPVAVHASPTSGMGDDAMPGAVRTDSAQELPEGVAVSISSSYGFTGETLEEGDTHHRGTGRLAVAYSLSPDFALGLRIDGRYDKHFVESGRDDGWVGDPRFLARYRTSLGSSLSAGVQLGLWAPGSDAPSLEVDALSAEVLAALTWASSSVPLQVSANAGYRLDRSAASVVEPERLSLSDRMSLGLSDYNAVLTAIGASYQAGPVELLAEWSLDLLHGTDAPSFRSSPMRVAFGARHGLSNGWFLFGTSEVRVSKFRSADVMNGLIPFEPRVSVLAGLQLRFGQSKGPITLVPIKEPVQPPPNEVAIVGTLAGVITSETTSSGTTPVGAAKLVLLDADGNEHEVAAGADGTFTFTGVALGTATLVASADGFEAKEQAAEITADGGVLDVSLTATLPPGQLRGQVRSFRGVGLESTLTVEPGGHSITSDAKGNFELDLPPGDYQVSIAVDGFKAQSRAIHIDENGVTILNVDIRKRDRKKGR